MLNVFKKQEVPRCCIDGCGKLIAVRDAVSIGINVYQKEILMKKNKPSDDCVVM